MNQSTHPDDKRLIIESSCTSTNQNFALGIEEEGFLKSEVTTGLRPEHQILDNRSGNTGAEISIADGTVQVSGATLEYMSARQIQETPRATNMQQDARINFATPKPVVRKRSVQGQIINLFMLSHKNF